MCLAFRPIFRHSSRYKETLRFVMVSRSNCYACYFLTRKKFKSVQHIDTLGMPKRRIELPTAGFSFALYYAMFLYHCWLLFLSLLMTTSASAFPRCFDLFSNDTTTDAAESLRPIPVQGKEVWEKRDGVFSYEDKTYNFSFDGVLRDGTLTLSFHLVDESGGFRSIHHGDELYDQMITHFGIKNIFAIEGSWSKGTNYDGFLKAYNAGATAKEAALQTWSGIHAKKYGFTLVKSIFLENERGELLMRPPARPAKPAFIEVLFTR